jgi:GNAT superfamily N-acetyltransferase
VLEGERVRVDLGAGEIVRLADSQRIGDVAWREEGGAFVVEKLSIDDAARGYGAGSEAARLLREYAAAEGWRTMRAWAPPDLGLAVYFWCRMGLRPLFGDGPNGGIWFERSLG